MASELVSEQVRGCLDACSECLQACEVCAEQCIAAADKEMVECVSLCRDTAALADLCITLLARGSRQVGALCHLCADACEACASECGRFDDPVMRGCADACERAAKACRQMGEPTAFTGA